MKGKIGTALLMPRIVIEKAAGRHKRRPVPRSIVRLDLRKEQPCR